MKHTEENIHALQEEVENLSLEVDKIGFTREKESLEKEVTELKQKFNKLENNKRDVIRGIGHLKDRMKDLSTDVRYF